MSGKDQLAAMLDELMGRNRNLLPDEKPQDYHYSAPEVCKHYLCGFCPHDLFVNTKADLGPCDKIHDEQIRKEYQKSSRYEKMGYETEFLRYLQQCLSEKERRIKRAQSRLELSARATAAGGLPKNEEKVDVLTDRINGMLEQVEELGSIGKVEDAQGVMRLVDQLKEEREGIRATAELATAQEKQMEVCQVCGAFLIVGDAQSRIDDHLMGKQHMGYAKIKSTIDEILNKRNNRDPDRDKQREEERKKREEEAEKEREERRKRREEREKEREKEREDRRKRRDDERKKRDSDRDRRRSRSRSRGRQGSARSRSRDRYRRRRSRSQERSRHSGRHRSHSRDRIRSGRSQSHEKSRHRSSRERSRERSRDSNSKSRDKIDDSTAAAAAATDKKGIEDEKDSDTRHDGNEKSLDGDDDDRTRNNDMAAGDGNKSPTLPDGQWSNSLHGKQEEEEKIEEDNSDDVNT